MDYEQKNQITAGYNQASLVAMGFAPIDKEPGFVDLVFRASRDNKHVFFGEPHVEGMLTRSYQLLADNPGSFLKAKENGIGHLALEMPQYFQPIADRFAEGKIDRLEFKNLLLEKFTSPWMNDPQARDEFGEVLTRTVENAHAAGMKVHMADVTWSDFHRDMNNNLPPDVLSFLKKVGEDHERLKPDVSIQQYIMDRMAALPGDERENLMTQARDHMNKARHERVDDSEQYGYLRERIPQNEGIMGLVGMSHLDNNLDFKMEKASMGIDDFLEAEGGKVASIELHNTDSKKIVASAYEDDRAVPLDRPDYTVMVDQKLIFDKQDRVVGSLDQSTPADRVVDRTVEQQHSPVNNAAPGTSVF